MCVFDIRISNGKWQSFSKMAYLKSFTENMVDGRVARTAHSSTDSFPLHIEFPKRS